MFCNVGFASPKGKSLYCYKDNYDQLDRGNFDYEEHIAIFFSQDNAAEVSIMVVVNKKVEDNDILLSEMFYYQVKEEEILLRPKVDDGYLRTYFNLNRTNLTLDGMNWKGTPCKIVNYNAIEKLKKRSKEFVISKEKKI